MPIPTWVVGQVLAAADVNSWFVPLAAVATTDLSIPSSTGVADPVLQLTVAANTTYQLDMHIRCNGPASTQFACLFTGPAGAALSAFTPGSGNQDIPLGSAFLGVTTIGAGVGSDLVFSVTGTLVTGSSTGTLQPSFAQGATTSPASTRRARSWLVLRRIG